MNVIEITNLTRDYGDGKGIFDVSFTISEGEVFGFLGPNGAGKTTTIRHLLGFIYAKSGSCSILGKDCGTNSAEIQKLLGYIPGEIALKNDMTGQQFLKFMAEYRGMKDMGRCAELMERFELNPKGKIKKMSKGMKQKIGIITAFMHDPKVLILDEPTSGLDPLMQNTFVKLIMEEKQRGKTILMSSHMFEEVERTCDRVGIIKDGKIVSITDVDTLRQNKQRQYCITFQSSEEAVRFAKEGFSVQTIEDQDVHVLIGHDIQKLIGVLNNYHVINLDIAQQSLEDLFMHFYGGESK